VCVLCGPVGDLPHWSEYRVVTSAKSDGGEEPLRRQDRFARLQLLRVLVAHYGLDCGDDSSSTCYWISNRRGSTVLVEHLGQFWAAAESLSGTRIDPLDAGLLEALGVGAPPA
jgi:hypothetical protein